MHKLNAFHLCFILEVRVRANTVHEACDRHKRLESFVFLIFVYRSPGALVKKSIYVVEVVKKTFAYLNWF